MATPTISPPDSLGAAIAPIAALSEPDFQKLVDATSTQRSFSLKLKDVKQLGEDLAPLAANLTFTLSALSFLYLRLEPLRSKTPLTEIVSKLVEDFDDQLERYDRKLLEKRLAKLLTENPDFASFRRAQRLEKGFLPNAVGFKTMVDLRPDFGGDESISFKGLLRIVQFRVLTDSENAQQKEFVFQLNEDSFDELKKVVDRAKDNLNALSDIADISQHLIGRERK